MELFVELIGDIVDAIVDIWINKIVSRFRKKK